ncbi:hypothetical protein QFZ82_001034 [Streptomyces sp. V4I23]|nr:hypothetical protein [Streptomyces sp. V4I23]
MRRASCLLAGVSVTDLINVALTGGSPRAA